MAKTAIVVSVSDTHTNSTVGLIPPVVVRDDGAERKAGPEQVWLWKQWLALVKRVRKLKKKHDARVIVVFSGDGPDRNKHSGGYDLITMSRAEIVRFTVQALRPLRNVADVWIQNRGTPAHEGGTGELAELVGKELDAHRHERGTWSWWNVEMMVEGVRFFFGHRPISNSTREHTRGNGAKRTAHDLWEAFHRMDDPCPDVFGFGHVHHWAKGQHLDTLCVYNPPWKLCDSFGHSIGYTAKTEPVGAWIFIVKGGRYELSEPNGMPWLRDPPRYAAIEL
jgi:hypothetical protein